MHTGNAHVIFKGINKGRCLERRGCLNEMTFIVESPWILPTQISPHPQLRLLHYGLEYPIDPSTHFTPTFRQSGRAAINLRQNSLNLLGK